MQQKFYSKISALSQNQPLGNKFILCKQQQKQKYINEIKSSKKISGHVK